MRGPTGTHQGSFPLCGAPPHGRVYHILLEKEEFSIHFVGFYLFYVDYNIWNGLREEGVHGQPLVILAGVFFILVGIYCIGTGAYALWKKEHKEGTPQEESIGEKKEEEED